ncbi:hydroxymethylbilane synthase [Nostocoides vanveenii]|jgi:hydroxymethylbilane synthase|uniref:Porphobilinogen deaminase n=1 Tax=Nostocoides vanveenii TaxID=330835 RepID=A0ABP4WM33_9MICO
MIAFRLGTRRSRLALTQSGQIADALRAAGHDVELVEIVTEGDTNRAALETIGGTGVFASALRRALRAGDIDLAVHSLKDLPTAPEAGLVIAATPVREDVRDVLVARDGLTLGELPSGARIGTGSPRREAQLVALGLGVEIVPIRGNVETRLALVDTGELDAVVLARAGLLRLGLADRATEVLDPIQVLPAAGQGALALECRADDSAVCEVLAALDDPETQACVTAERTVLALLEAGCTAPVGVLAEVVEGVTALDLSVRAFVGTRDGALQLRRSVTGPADDPVGVGTRLAALLLADGAAQARVERGFGAPASPTTPSGGTTTLDPPGEGQLAATAEPATRPGMLAQTTAIDESEKTT